MFLNFLFRLDSWRSADSGRATLSWRNLAILCKQIFEQPSHCSSNVSGWWCVEDQMPELSRTCQQHVHRLVYAVAEAGFVCSCFEIPWRGKFIGEPGISTRSILIFYSILWLIFMKHKQHRNKFPTLCYFWLSFVLMDQSKIAL